MPNLFYLITPLLLFNSDEPHIATWLLLITCFTLSVFCLSLPIWIISPFLSALLFHSSLGKPLRISMTRRNFKSLLFDSIRTKSSCLLIYNYFLFVSEIICVTVRLLVSSVSLQLGFINKVGSHLIPCLCGFTCTFHMSSGVTLASVCARLY